MLKKIKELCLSLGVFSLIAVPVFVPAVAFADNTILDNICSGSNNDTSGASTDCDDGGTNAGIDGILRQVIKIFSIIVGFVAVVMIIVGGIKYITSGGEAGNISGAKNTIIYAVIGLIIVALAQVLVHYVIKNVSNASTN